MTFRETRYTNEQGNPVRQWLFAFYGHAITWRYVDNNYDPRMVIMFESRRYLITVAFFEECLPLYDLNIVCGGYGS